MLLLFLTRYNTAGAAAAAADSVLSRRWESPEFIPSWVDEESGLKISSFQTEPPAKCKCKDMYWAVRELGVYRDNVPMGLCKDTARAP